MKSTWQRFGSAFVTTSLTGTLVLGLLYAREQGNQPQLRKLPKSALQNVPVNTYVLPAPSGVSPAHHFGIRGINNPPGSFWIAYWVNDTTIKGPGDTVSFFITPLVSLPPGQCGADFDATTATTVFIYPWDMMGDTMVNTAGKCFGIDTFVFVYYLAAPAQDTIFLFIDHLLYDTTSRAFSPTPLQTDTLILDTGILVPGGVGAISISYPLARPLTFQPNMILAYRFRIQYQNPADTLFLVFNAVENCAPVLCPPFSRTSRFANTTWLEFAWAGINLPCNNYANADMTAPILDQFCGNNNGIPDGCEFIPLQNLLVQGHIVPCDSVMFVRNVPDTVYLCPGDTQTLNLMWVNRCAPEDFRWFRNDTLLDTTFLTSLTVSVPGTYVVVASNQCFTQRDTIVVLPAPGLSFQVQIVNDTIAYVSVNTGLPPFTVMWTTPDPANPMVPGDTVIFTVEGQYCAIVSDGCTMDTACVQFTPTGLLVASSEEVPCLLIRVQGSTLQIQCPEANIGQVQVVLPDGRILSPAFRQEGSWLFIEGVPSDVPYYMVRLFNSTGESVGNFLLRPATR